MNSDKIICSKNKLIQGLDKEFKKAQNLLWNLEEFEELKDEKKKNKKGSFLNILCCIFENKILQKAIHEYGAAVPMFDGFMFIKKDKEKYDYLLEEDGIIQWDYKENISDTQMTDFDEFDSQDYYTIKEWFEKTHCLIKAKPLVFLEKQTDNEGKLINKFYTEKDM